MSGREPRPRLPRSVPLIALGLTLTWLLGAVAVRDGRARDATVDLVLDGARTTSAATGAGPVQEAVLELRVRNQGGSPVALLDQRLDGGGLVDPGPAGPLTAGGAVLLAVRWRVLCAEVGTLFGPRALDLTAQPRRGGPRRVQLPLDPATRQAFRSAASDACAP